MKEKFKHKAVEKLETIGDFFICEVGEEAPECGEPEPGVIYGTQRVCLGDCMPEEFNEVFDTLSIQLTVEEIDFLLDELDPQVQLSDLLEPVGRNFILGLADKLKKQKAKYVKIKED